MNRNKKIQIGESTAIGLVRKNQEDSYACTLLKSHGYFCAVSDGMGGMPAGEVASKITIETVQSIINYISITPLRDRLEIGLELANSKVIREGQKNPSIKGLGATFTGGILIQKHLYLAHVGDSRAYLYRHGQLTHLTQDHHVGHYLSNCVGVNEGLFWVEKSNTQLENGDIVLLCTDGLTNLVNDNGISKILSGSSSAQMMADNLVLAALENGGFDNCTVLVMIV